MPAVRIGVLTVLCALGLIARTAAGQPPARPSPPPPDTPREDTRVQYPAVLANSYLSLNFGYISYDFTDRQLEPGFSAGSVDVPHAAGRIVIGHELNDYLSAQITYSKPVHYVTYNGVDGGDHHLVMHVGGATLKVRAPIAARLSGYVEGGIGVTARRGFGRADTPLVRNSQYASPLAGAGFDYRLNRSWDLTVGAVYTPGRAEDRQPHTLLASSGIRYTLRPLPPERVQAVRDAGFSFPLNLVQLEYSTGYGYGINTFLSKHVPVFCGGSVEIDRGLALHYTRNVFHTRKFFALDLGVSGSSWQSRYGKDRLFTLSMYPLLRLTLVRTQAADLYFAYSLAGPTYISQEIIDGHDTGTRFTFQDFMGGGVLLGPRRNVSVGVKINHYSNGNIFADNAGLKIPITVTLGYAF